MSNSNVAIKIKNMSKCYYIGIREPYKTIADTITSAIKFSNLEKRSNLNKKKFWALKDISFELDKGSVFGIIGRNGAGKSTLLKILSRITYPTIGNVEIHGRVGSLLEVGTGFHPELSGRENIYLSGSILGMKKSEINQNFDQIVRFSEIEQFIDTPVKRYSSGMYVRLAFSVAAHLDSNILLVDEVLAVGDSQFQKKCMGKMKSITNEGRTVLFVSHNIGSISSLCDKGLLLEEGKLEAMGDISDVVSKYISHHESSNDELVWTQNSAPGDNTIRLKSVKITLDGKSCKNIPINMDFKIEISYWNLVEKSPIMVGLHLLDRNGYTVFESGNVKSAILNIDKWAGAEYPIGLFLTTCVIPKNFLNDGIYYVSILLLTNTSRLHTKLDEILSFSIFDTGEMRKEYAGEWKGVIRPKLDWRTEFIKEGH
jgi:lipopolysaccharide transport system ATP-binding protein